MNLTLKHLDKKIKNEANYLNKISSGRTSNINMNADGTNANEIYNKLLNIRNKERRVWNDELKDKDSFHAANNVMNQNKSKINQNEYKFNRDIDYLYYDAKNERNGIYNICRININAKIPLSLFAEVIYYIDDFETLQNISLTCKELNNFILLTKRTMNIIQFNSGRSVPIKSNDETHNFFYSDPLHLLTSMYDTNNSDNLDDNMTELIINYSHDVENEELGSDLRSLLLNQLEMDNEYRELIDMMKKKYIDDDTEEKSINPHNRGNISYSTI
jgi:hypothetical protein